MVFQGSFMVFGWFPWFFKVVSWFSWFLLGFHDYQGGFMVFQGGFMVFHGFWLVSMVFEGFQVDFHCH